MQSFHQKQMLLKLPLLLLVHLLQYLLLLILQIVMKTYLSWVHLELLVFCYLDLAIVPFSQPRNIFFGHVISTFMGLFFFHFVGNYWWSLALALALAIAVMLLTRTVHPPAGSNPVIVFIMGSSWDFLFFPTALGATIIILVGVFYNNLHKKRVYPNYWI